MGQLYKFGQKEILMENDDRQTGQLLSRRDALKLLGVASAALWKS
jgi:hypothetical protein